MKKTTLLLILFLILTSVFPLSFARADAAPPEAPPGTNLLPGESITQVRMVAETVTLTISKHPSNPQGAIAKTEAVFTMRNLGTTEEKMAVRFPLSFFNGNSDGYGEFPEIPSIAVKVDGKSMPTRREIQPFAASEYSYTEREEIPWAVFDVTFPPNQEVIIEVVYNVNGYGYYPYEAFKYILETGAGWNGTIGSAEVIIRLPYEVSEQNLDLTGQAGHGESTPGGVRSGNEIRWSFKDLEPTYMDNIQIVVVTPSLWEKVLKEKETAAKNSSDGETWGRLAKAYKEAAMMPKGYLREDRAGLELYALSKDAYEKCLALLPNDPLWQYGYADLLWARYYFGIHLAGEQDSEGILTKTLTALQTTLALDPKNQQAKDLLQEMAWAIPEAVQVDGNNFVLLGLTATPIPPTRYPTETPPPTFELVATAQAESTPEAQPAPTEVPFARNPLCGSAFLLPALLGMILLNKRKFRM
ncbi:MAG: hypothetical protein QY332_07715 [Anaerolineales bacterium]|nr:MAG: hypothetical protein QY332_07715 [Anaerolineales bacterium]